MSVLIVVCGSASNSAQFHLPSADPASSRPKVQSSGAIRGVGPADSTGKSVVTYCPGGTRSFGVCSCRLDLNPREIGASDMGITLLSGPALCRLFEELEKIDRDPGPHSRSPATF